MKNVQKGIPYSCKLTPQQVKIDICDHLYQLSTELTPSIAYREVVACSNQECCSYVTQSGATFVFENCEATAALKGK